MNTQTKENIRKFFDGLYGKNSIEFVRGLVFVYPFGVIGKENNNTVKPHLHNNQFQIFVVMEGVTELIYKDEKIIIEGPSFITVPKNTEHGFFHRTEMKGWIISLSDSVLEHMVKREIEVISAIETFQVTKVKDDEYSQTVYESMLECISEYQREDVGRLLMLEFLVGKIVVQLSRLPKSEQIHIEHVDNSAIIYFRRFAHLIRETHSYKKSIEEYAEELNITAGHLNRVCAAVADKSPKEVLMDYHISEAQVLLSDVEKSINEVGYSIGFEDPSYFSRVFKKKTGLTPNEFRKMIGVKH